MIPENISNLSDYENILSEYNAKVENILDILQNNKLKITRSLYRCDPQDITRVITLKNTNIQTVRSDKRLLAIYSDNLLELAYYSLIQRKFKLTLRYIRVRNVFNIIDRKSTLLKALVFLRSGHIIKYYMIASPSIQNNIMIKKITCLIPFQITRIYTYNVLKDKIFFEKIYYITSEDMLGILRMGIGQNFCFDRVQYIYPFKSTYIINSKDELELRIKLIIKYFKADVLKLNCHLILFADLLNGIDFHLFLKIMHLRVLFPENILILITHNRNNHFKYTDSSKKMKQCAYELNELLMKTYLFAVVIGDIFYIGSKIPDKPILLKEIDSEFNGRGRDIIPYEKYYTKGKVHPTVELKRARKFLERNKLRSAVIQRENSHMKIIHRKLIYAPEPKNIIEVHHEVFSSKRGEAVEKDFFIFEKL